MKSKKLFFGSLIVLLIMGSTASAQLRFGIKGEMGINKPSLTKELYSVENMNDFKVGPTLEFMLPIADLGIEGALLYSNEKMKVKDFKADKLLDEISNHCLDIPVNLKYKIGIISPIKIFGAAGPYANLRLAGDNFKYDAIKDIVEAKKFQAGVNLGIGAEIINKIQIGVNYRMRLTDDYSINKPELKELQDALNNKSGFWSITAAIYL